MGSSARAPVLTVVPALVDLAPLPRVARLAATLGHLASVEEAASAIQTLDITGLRGRSCGENSTVMNAANGFKPTRARIKYVTPKQMCFSVTLPPEVAVPAYRLQLIDKNTRRWLSAIPLLLDNPLPGLCLLLHRHTVP